MPPLYYQRPAHHYYVSPYQTNHHCGCGLDPRHHHRQPVVYRQPIYYDYDYPSNNDYDQGYQVYHRVPQQQAKYRIQQEYLERKALEELLDAITLELNNISSTRDSSQDQSEATEKPSPKLKRCPASRCVPSEAPAKKHKPTTTNQSTINETPTLESVMSQFIGSSDPTTHPLFSLAKTFFENVHQQQHQQQHGQEEQAGSTSSSAKDVKGKGVHIKSSSQPRKVEINVEEKQDEELARAIEESLKDQAEQSAGSSSGTNQASSSSSKSSSSPSEGGESMIEKLQKSSIPIVESSDSSSEHGDWEKPEKSDE